MSTSDKRPEFCAVPATQTTASLAKLWNLPITDLWFPCAANANSKGIIEVNEATPIAFAIAGPSTLPTEVIFDRMKIVEHLKLIPPRPQQFSVAEAVLAKSNGVLYVRATAGASGGRTRAAEGALVMKRRVTTEESIEEGSSFPRNPDSHHGISASVTKRSVASSKKGVSAPASERGQSGTPSTATTAASGLAWRDAMEQLLAERLKKERSASIEARNGKRERETDAEVETDTALQTSGDDFLQKVHETIRKVRGEAPLHLVKLFGGNFKEIILRVGSPFQVGTRVWLRPDLSIISYQHLPEANRNVAGAKDRLFAPQRLIAVLPILQCLMEPKSLDDDLLELEPRLIHDGLPDTLKRLAARGYKIVLMEHFPMLHHGNAYALQTIANRIAAFIETHLPSIAVQVVLSVGSFYASGMLGVSRCLLPNAGVYQVFLYHYNGQIEADESRSFFVKTQREKVGGYGFSSCTFEEQDGFAACCGRKGLKAISFSALEAHAAALCS